MVAALNRCRELGYLDDEAYAKALVRRRSPARGSAAIAAELASKGIGRELARSLLQDEAGAEVELEAAVRLLARAAPSAAERTKLSGKLQRRGFSPEVVRRAWRRLEMLDTHLTEG